MTRYYINKKYKLLDIKISKKVNSNLLGFYKSAFKGNGMEYTDSRKFEDGDNYKYIDWITTAKTNSLYLKQFEEEKQLKLLFLIDNDISMDFGLYGQNKFQTATELIYLLSLVANSNNDYLGGFSFNTSNSKFIDFGKGKANILKILSIIGSGNDYSNRNIVSLNSVLKKLMSYKIKNTLIFIVSDKIDINFDSILKSLSKINEVCFVNVFDSFENTLEGIEGVITLKNNENSISIDLSKKELINQYKVLRNNKIALLKTNLNRAGIDYLSIDENSDLVKKLLLFFQRKALGSIY